MRAARGYGTRITKALSGPGRAAPKMGRNPLPVPVASCRGGWWMSSDDFIGKRGNIAVKRGSNSELGGGRIEQAAGSNSARRHFGLKLRVRTHRWPDPGHPGSRRRILRVCAAKPADPARGLRRHRPTCWLDLHLDAPPVPRMRRQRPRVPVGRCTVWASVRTRASRAAGAEQEL